MQINSINPNYTNTKLNNRRSERVQKTTTFETAELSGCKAGRAILAQNNISFRNLDRPVEVTHLYNKKTEGKDHLDLPNIHVYEFPDTNLKVIVDTLSTVNKPLAMVELVSNKNDYNPIKSNLIKFMLNDKLKKLDPEIKHFNENDYSIYYIPVSDSKFEKFNNINTLIYSPEFTDEDLSKAKEKLINYYFSPEYQNNNVDLNYLYSKSSLKTDEEVIENINKINLGEIKNYYTNSLKDASGAVHIFLSKQDFISNKGTILRNINTNIPLKLSKKQIIDYQKQPFIPNQHTVIIQGLPGFMPLDFNYPIVLESEKDSLISEMVEDMLFSNKYFITTKAYSNPINIKDSKNIQTGYYMKAGVNLDFNSTIDWSGELKDFNAYLQDICNSNLQAELTKIKTLYKENARYDRLENDDLFDRYLSEGSLKKIFYSYELIDSITEEDIKEFINKYLINQIPIMHINKEYDE